MGQWGHWRRWIGGGYFVTAAALLMSTCRSLVMASIDNDNDEIPRFVATTTDASDENVVNTSNRPLVVTTWANDGFQRATRTAWQRLATTGDRIEAVVAGTGECEALQCDFTVGFGGSPDENGETILESIVMDGPGHKMGAVAQMGRVKSASRVAQAVMKHTKHSMLAGNGATAFAGQMGFKVENLTTGFSEKVYRDWKANKCQPNYWQRNVSPDPLISCGPYTPTSDEDHHYSSNETPKRIQQHRQQQQSEEQSISHDTIGMIVVDSKGDVSVATSTNGANHKIAGRVGDSSLPGCGAYVDNNVGAAAATGDGDIMMRFVPSYQTVESMRLGMDPQKAAADAISRIASVYPDFAGAIIAATKDGRYGAACNGLRPANTFTYCVFNNESSDVQLITVQCT